MDRRRNPPSRPRAEAAPAGPDADVLSAEDEGRPADLSGDARVLRPRRAAPADAVRPTRAEINLAHLRHNLRVLERALAYSQSTRAEPSPDDATRAEPSPDDAARAEPFPDDATRAEPSADDAARASIWGVLKADAYGHGAPAVARTLERARMPGLCVALLEEGIELRAAGIRAPILVMGGYYGQRPEGLEEMLAHGLIPVVYTAEQVERIASIVRLHGGSLPRTELPFAPAPSDGRVAVHLKLDTGMGRLGAPAADVDDVLRAIAGSPEVRLDGLMTHFACADGDDLEVTRAQLRRFAAAGERARSFGLSPRIRHAANSAAMLRLPEARLDVVRPGIALFGVSPRSGLPFDLRPVMRVRSEIVALRWIEPGDSIGYGHTFRAARRSLIATVPMGYADGLSRQLSNRGHALVRGKRAPIVGTMSMDLTMIDVTDVANARMPDEVVFLGAQEGPLGRDAVTAEEIAELTGTIAWEVLTSISRRVPRFYREP